jgi:hypothetical protein
MAAGYRVDARACSRCGALAASDCIPDPGFKDRSGAAGVDPDESRRCGARWQQYRGGHIDPDSGERRAAERALQLQAHTRPVVGPQLLQRLAVAAAAAGGSLDLA